MTETTNIEFAAISRDLREQQTYEEFRNSFATPEMIKEYIK